MRVGTKLSIGIALLSLAVVAVAAAPVFGQRGGRRGPGPPSEEYRGPGGPPGEFRGPGPPGGDRRGPGPPGGDRGGPGRGFRGPFGGEDGQERFERFLRELDANRNGRVEENEVEGRRRFFVEMMARRAGVEPRFPMSVSRLREATARRAREDGDGGPGSTRGTSEGSGTRAASQDPLVPGFGVELDLAAPLKFGERAADGSTAAANSSSRSRSGRGSSSRGGESDDRIRGWAEAMMRQNDRNRNGRLERDEWRGMRGNPEEADRNHDGVITLDELTARLNDFSRRRSRERDSNPPGSSDSSPPESASSSDNSEKRKSYRFLTPIERWPEGLPDWFARKDINGDGQVAMAEYESPGSWTDAIVAEFIRYDLNNDGVITPGECLKAETAGKIAMVGQGPRGPAPPSGESRRPGPSGRDRRGPGPPGRESPTVSVERNGPGGAWEGW